MRSRLILLIFILLVLSSGAIAAEPYKFVYYDSYPPRSWSEDGKMKGILVDVVSEALEERLGLKVSHQGYPWARAQAMVQKGMADAFVTVPTDERKSYTEVSQVPVIKFELFIAARKDHPQLKDFEQIRSIDELKPFQLVDYFGNGFAQKKFKEFNVEWLPNIEAVYPFLASGKADILLVSDRGIYDLKRLGYEDQITVFKFPLYSLRFHLCVGKNSQLKNHLADIDRVLDTLWAEGTVDSISQSYYK